jgi:hypothetical protein
VSEGNVKWGTETGLALLQEYYNGEEIGRDTIRNLAARIDMGTHDKLQTNTRKISIPRQLVLLVLFEVMTLSCKVICHCLN